MEHNIENKNEKLPLLCADILIFKLINEKYLKKMQEN